MGDEEFNLVGRMFVDSSRSPGFDPDTVGTEYDGGRTKSTAFRRWRLENPKFKVSLGY